MGLSRARTLGQRALALGVVCLLVSNGTGGWCWIPTRHEKIYYFLCRLGYISRRPNISFVIRCNVPYTADLGNRIHRLTSSLTPFPADYALPPPFCALYTLSPPFHALYTLPPLLCALYTLLPLFYALYAPVGNGPSCLHQSTSSLQ
jgi:hypothetical protein